MGLIAVAGVAAILARWGAPSVVVRDVTPADRAEDPTPAGQPDGLDGAWAPFPEMEREVDAGVRAQAKSLLEMLDSEAEAQVDGVYEFDANMAKVQLMSFAVVPGEGATGAQRREIEEGNRARRREALAYMEGRKFAWDVAIVDVSVGRAQPVLLVLDAESAAEKKAGTGGMLRLPRELAVNPLLLNKGDRCDLVFRCDRMVLQEGQYIVEGRVMSLKRTAKAGGWGSKRDGEAAGRRAP